MGQLQPITQKQSKIEVSALTGIFWTSIKGGKMSHEEVGYSDGQAGMEKTFTGLMKIEPITLTKPYDPVNDKAIQTFLNSQRATKTAFNVTVTPVNTDVAGSPLPGGQPQTYSNCMVLSYTPAQFDRNGTGLAMVELVLAVNSLPTY